MNLEEEDTGKRSKKRLDLAMWQLAWDRCDVLLIVRLHRVGLNCCRYTVAAVALEQLSFADCIRHKAVVMDVATTEAKEGGNAVLGVFYDIEARCASVFGVFVRSCTVCVLAGPSGQTKRPSWAPSFCCSQSCRRARVFEIDIGFTGADFFFLRTRHCPRCPMLLLGPSV